MEHGGIPAVLPGIVALDEHPGEGRRIAVRHRTAQIKLLTVPEVRAGQEEIHGSAIGTGPVEHDLITDGIGPRTDTFIVTLAEAVSRTSNLTVFESCPVPARPVPFIQIT